MATVEPTERNFTRSLSVAAGIRGLDSCRPRQPRTATAPAVPATTDPETTLRNDAA